jgi:hypothetical protein
MINHVISLLIRQLLKHSPACTLSGSRELLEGGSINFTLEKSLSTSVNIPGIENTSLAIRARRGN